MHSSKQLPPISVTLFGIVIDVSDSQSWKHELPRVTNSVGKTIAWRFEQA